MIKALVAKHLQVQNLMGIGFLFTADFVDWGQIL